MTRQRSSEAGITTVEVVLTAPALLLMLMLVVQYGLVAHAQSVARSAAEEGAAQARRFDGTEAAAAARTNTYLDDLGPTIIQHRLVVAERTLTTATVSVDADVVSLVPGFSFEVHESASGPVERYVPETGP